LGHRTYGIRLPVSPAQALLGPRWPHQRPSRGSRLLGQPAGGVHCARV